MRKPILVPLDEDLLADIDRLVEQEGLDSRLAFIRQALRWSVRNYVGFFFSSNTLECVSNQSVKAASPHIDQGAVS